MEDELTTAIREALKHASELPNSREKSLVITKLDEALLWTREEERLRLLRQSPSPERS